MAKLKAPFVLLFRDSKFSTYSYSACLLAGEEYHEREPQTHFPTSSGDATSKGPPTSLDSYGTHVLHCNVNDSSATFSIT